MHSLQNGRARFNESIHSVRLTLTNSFIQVSHKGWACALQVLLSGPADVLDPTHETPYALGLFEFHVSLPPLPRGSRPARPEWRGPHAPTDPGE